MQGLVRLQFFRYGFDATISHWCEGTDWNNPVPVGRYSKGKAEKLFKNAGFESVSITKCLLTRGNIPVLGKFLSVATLEMLARFIGWNLIIKARK